MHDSKQEQIQHAIGTPLQRFPLSLHGKAGETKESSASSVGTALGRLRIIDSCKQATTPIWIPKLRLLLARPQGRNHQACFLSQPGESTDRHSLFDFRCADFAGPNALLTFKVLIAK